MDHRAINQRSRGPQHGLDRPAPGASPMAEPAADNPDRWSAPGVWTGRPRWRATSSVPRRTTWHQRAMAACLAAGADVEAEPPHRRPAPRLRRPHRPPRAADRRLPAGPPSRRAHPSHDPPPAGGRHRRRRDPGDVGRPDPDRRRRPGRPRRRSAAGSTGHSCADQLDLADPRPADDGADRCRGRERSDRARCERHALRSGGHDPGRSVFEARVIEAAGRRALPPLVRQHPVERPDGRTAFIDLADPPAMAAIELDGWETHGVRSAFEPDRIRGNELLLLGWNLLRFTWPMTDDYICDTIARPRSTSSRLQPNPRDSGHTCTPRGARRPDKPASASTARYRVTRAPTGCTGDPNRARGQGSGTRTGPSSVRRPAASQQPARTIGRPSELAAREGARRAPPRPGRGRPPG